MKHSDVLNTPPLPLLDNLPPLPSINDPELLEFAITHSSYHGAVRQANDLDLEAEPVKDWEKLEFVGDSILGE